MGSWGLPDTDRCIRWTSVHTTPDSWGQGAGGGGGEKGAGEGVSADGGGGGGGHGSGYNYRSLREGVSNLWDGI